MNKKYLIRLDDACPEMDKQKWKRIEDILDKYEIKPLVGIIPNNQDSHTCIDSYDHSFVVKAQRWERKGWSIALHGYNHICGTTDGGINPVHHRSEFAGLSYDEQKKKINEGYKILHSWGLKPTYFFAPSHTYDENTLKAIETVTPIRIVSDTIALKPYKQGNFMIVPCQMGRFRNVPIDGYWTFCFHPNGMDDKAFAEFEEFIKLNRTYFIGFDDIDMADWGCKTLVDKILSSMYFMMRRVKG